MVIRAGIAGGNYCDNDDNKEEGGVVMDMETGVGSATGSIANGDNPSTEIDGVVLENDDFRRRVYRSAEYSGAEVGYSDEKLVP